MASRAEGLDARDDGHNGVGHAGLRRPILVECLPGDPQMGELADQFRDDGLASNRGDNGVAASESPIADAVALAAKFAHDHVAAKCHESG